jgi:hypothetical protein
VGEEPGVEVRIVVGFGPGVVAGFGVDGEFDGGVALFLEGFDHFLGFGEGDGLVLGAVEDPDGELFEAARGEPGFAAAADGGDGGEFSRVFGGEVPGAVSAHAEAGEIDAVGVDAVIFFEVFDEMHEFVGIPPIVFGALGGSDDEGEGFAFCDELGRAVCFDEIEIMAAFTGAVEEENEGKFFAGFFFVVVGEGEEVIDGDGFFEGGAELLGGLAGVRRGGRGQGEEGNQGQEEEEKKAGGKLFHVRDTMSG